MNNIIKNITFDIKLSNKFYVINDTIKIKKNSNYILNNFDLVSIEKSYNYGCAIFKYKNSLCLSFSSQLNANFSFILKQNFLNNDVKNYLHSNYNTEVLISTIEYSNEYL